MLAAAQPYQRQRLYVPRHDDYLEGFQGKPGEFSAYGGEGEPVVSPKGTYDVSADAWLTVNHYNALVLNTRNMLIADVDFGDERLNRYAGAEDCDEVVKNLKQLHLLDEEHMRYDELQFSDQSYRVYRTHSGCRVICTSVCVPWEQKAWAAQRFMQFVRSDPQYIELCGVQKCYRARLTPKPWRDNGEPAHVCELEEKVGNGRIADDLEEQLKLHDEMTLRDAEWSHLA